MKKEVLQTFISRYILGGEINKVKWKYSVVDKTLHTKGATDNRSFISDVIMHDFSDFGNEDLVICIGDTEKVNKMMSPFKDDVNISINRNGDRILGFTLSDADCECYCTAADPSSIEPMPKSLVNAIEWDVIVPLTNELITKFLKAQSALKDITTFTVAMNKKSQFEIVIGHITANSNRIRIVPQTDPEKNKLTGQPLIFPVKNVVEVLNANKDITGGVMSINSAGILHLYFKNDKYTCTYFQFCNKKV